MQCREIERQGYRINITLSRYGPSQTLHDKDLPLPNAEPTELSVHNGSERFYTVLSNFDAMTLVERLVRVDFDAQSKTRWHEALGEFGVGKPVQLIIIKFG